jgi:hypothetical protein
MIGAEHAGAPTSRKLAAAARAGRGQGPDRNLHGHRPQLLGQRIALEAEVLRWLGQFDPASAKSARRVPAEGRL